MRILVLVIPIVIAMTLPVLFRRAVGVRVLSVVILSAIALFHFTYLMAGHRIIMEDGARQLAVGPGSQLPPDFLVAVDSIQRHNQQMLWPFAALTVALVFLVLFPFETTKQRAPNADT